MRASLSPTGTPGATMRRLAGGVPQHQRLVFGGLAGIVLLDTAAYWIQVAMTPGLVRRYAGVDYSLYMDVTRRSLSRGPFYSPYQLAGPYAISAGDVLYPPVALILLVPFTVLPAVLWWLVPLAGTSYALIRLRPVPMAWPLLAYCAWWATSGLKVLTGNPVMWAMAAVALGALYDWPSVLVILKPSLFPFALFRSWRRSWWIAMALLALASLPFGVMWRDWLTALTNSRGRGLLYSTMEIPLLAAPIVAWLASPIGPIVDRLGATSVAPSDSGRE